MECDVVFLMKNQTPSAVVVAIHYLALHGLYGGYTAVVYSVFFISRACELPGTERAVGGSTTTTVRGDNLNTLELGRPHKSRLRVLEIAPV